MCWSHFHRNVALQMKSISSHNKSLSESILKDLVDLQLSALNEQSFREGFELIKNKYLGIHGTVLNGCITHFFNYMHKVWIDSKECRWYEGAHPWCIGNNQGVEGKNKDIKQNHTFRRRFQLGELIDVLANLVTEWSEEVDVILESSRLSGLHGQKDSRL